MSNGPEQVQQPVTLPDVDAQKAMLDAMFGDEAEQYADLIVPPDAEMQRAMLDAMFGDEAGQYEDLIVDPESTQTLVPDEVISPTPAEPLTADEQSVLDRLEQDFDEKSPSVIAPETHGRGRRLVGRTIGALALVGAIAAGLLTGTVVQDKAGNQVSTVSEQASTPSTTSPVAIGGALRGSNETTATTEATTTEAQPVVRTYEAQTGEVIGVLKIPKLCEEIQVVAFDEQDKIQGKIGQGSALIDALSPDPTPTETCDPLDEYVDAVRNDSTNPEYNPDYIRRSERVRNSSRGRVDQWQPVAGFEMRDGVKLSMYPGEPGNAVIPGHGSTYSAPFADASALETGDLFVFERSDGAKFLYKVIGYELTKDYNVIRHYENPEFASTISMYNCTDEQGETGSDATRGVTRAGLVQVLA